MSRKKAGEFLDILLDPKRGKGLLGSPQAPIRLSGAVPDFPGLVGLGSTKPIPTTVAKPERARLFAGEEADAARGRFRMDLAVAGLLGLLVTNLVSFTLGARAGRNAGAPATPAVAASPGAAAPDTVYLEQMGKPAEIAKAAVPPAAAAPAGPAAPVTTEPIPLSLVGPGPLPPTPPPAPKVEEAAERSPIGKFVIRIISLPGDAAGKARAQQIRAHVEGLGFKPAVARASGKSYVVEVGAYDSANGQDIKGVLGDIKKARCDYDTFSDSFVLKRTQ
ncbi:MAG: hypothetical protein L0216_20170 [Planctomycetales bacterium]|nr:hypothetical protein [Planctomycetales bacterium]